MNYLVLDLETTGFSRTRDRIIEIGVVPVADGVVGEPASVLVNPERTLDPEITKLTGLEQKDVDAGMSLGAALSWLSYLSENADLIVGHNILRFDWDFLMQAQAQTGVALPLSIAQVVDTGVLYLAYERNLRPFIGESHQELAQRVHFKRPQGLRWSLAIACMAMGLPDNVVHRAAPDALRCQMLYEALWPLLMSVERPRVQAARL